MCIKVLPRGVTPPPEGKPPPLPEEKKKSPLSTFGRDVTIGSIAGAAAVMVFKPMMYAKIVAQSANIEVRMESSSMVQRLWTLYRK